MSNRTPLLLLLGSLLTGALWATEDPFIGEWNLNATKSKLTDEMKVNGIGTNKYAFDFGGGTPETIVTDGTDQPANDGTTLSVTAVAPDSWKVVRKKDGRIIITAAWKLSEDGNTLTDNFTGVGPKGSTYSLLYVYKRTAGKEGFAGTWTSAQVDAVFLLQVRPYEGDGLSFIDPEQTKNVKFDGQEHPSQSPSSKPGSVYSGRRVDNRTLEVTNKVNGKTIGTQQIELSPDLKTLTMTVRQAGTDKPNVLVFDRK